MTTWNDFYTSPEGNGHFRKGWFRREGMICAPVHVLADAQVSTEQTNVWDRKTTNAQRILIGRMEAKDTGGEARESTTKTNPCRQPDKRPISRDGRTIICGDSNTERGTCQPECASCPVTSPVPTGRGNSAVSELPQCRVSREVRPVAAISGKVGRW